MLRLLASSFEFIENSSSMATFQFVQIPLNFFRSIPFIFSDRRLLWYCAVPYAIGFVSFIVFAVALFSYESSLLQWLFGDLSGWVDYLLTLVGWLLILALSGVVALIFLSLAGAWFIESFIHHSLTKGKFRAEIELEEVGFVKSTLRGLRDDGIRIVYIALIILLSFLFSFFPPLVFIPVLLGAFLVGFDLVDLPLTLLGYDFQTRWSLVKSHGLRVVVLGGCYSLLLLIPLVNIFFLPVAYQAAIFSIESWELPNLKPG